MPLKLKYGKNRTGSARGFFSSSLVRGLLIAVLACLAIGVAIFGIAYFHYQHVVDDRLAAGPIFASESQIYAAPREVRPGQKLTAASIAADLRRVNYNGNPQLGTFNLNGDTIFIKPGPESYHSTDGATIDTTGGVVQKITAENGVALAAYDLEPQLITALSEDSGRTKRRLITYDNIPPQLVQAVTAIEDRRFFEHSGVDYVRIAKCAVQDVISWRMSCGGSTLTQQLARGFFLTPQKHIVRKLKEVMITFQLEARFNKQQIFEMYANEIPLGQRGSYAINGFGEAAQTYFGKPLRQLDTAQCALLAGLIQSPSRLNPYRHPERAMTRRNVVLNSMVETGALTASEASQFKAEPIRLAPSNIDASEAPYFVDLVHDQLVRKIGDQDLSHQNLRIYTSLDPDLQNAASEAVQVGMKNVDELVRRKHRNRKGEIVGDITYPQVALIALNPHTGQVLALVGGRNYSVSQLDHALAERPTGSIFKPFVYATAFNTSLNGTQLGDSGGVFTSITQLNDDPQDFGTDGKSYTPGNMVHGEYPGMVTAITALEHSLNIATIALAQQAGYGNVAALARSAGIVNARGTPSVAIGTYNATPLEMAGAYTVFANNGVHLDPWLLASVRNSSGDIVADFAPQARQILDPRVAYLTHSLLEDVMNHGTGIVARAHGFTAPAAGKTGTEHDAWFAGYTSNLLCIVWVGNDDYTDIKLQGADAAAPIWAEFMNRAIKLPQYSDVKSFSPPSGVTVVSLDKTSNLLADGSCPSDYSAAFLDGTAPQNYCSQMGENPQNFIQRIFGIGGNKPAPPAAAPHPTTPQAAHPYAPAPAAAPNAPPAQNASETQEAKPKKKNFFQKLFGGGGDKDKQSESTDPPQ
ncbi:MULTISPECIES: transglycosylase domain-containing protein [Acidobacteriaceae]|uniref:transglycosylase domain-containing protein n=1 Tax=Acidobacteriaceae TaxID=204434 RepID=UPI00131CDDB6|nr:MULTISPECIES: transglycosylase domain-containing protein [Acidobacteriaceae]MDW5266535.1 transglycosylase domain-containing protein [Edaphobacter sp.]